MSYVFAVGILHGPGFTRQAFAVFVEYIHLGNAGQVFPVLRTECFQTDVASADGLVEFYFLPSVAGLEAATEYGFLGREVQILSFGAVSQRFAHLQLVEQRFAQAFTLSFFRTYDVEYQNFVFAFLQPASRYVESLLRTDFPDASQSISVHVNQPFAPCLEVQESVAGLLHVEGGAVAARDALSLFVLQRADGFELHAFIEFVCVFDVENFPVLQVADEGITVHVDGQFHVLRDAFEVLDGTSKVDASHGFYQDVELCSLAAGGQGNLLFAVAAVQLADVLAVDEDLCIVVRFVDGEQCRNFGLRQRSAVQNAAEALVVLFHRADVFVFLGSRQVGEEWGHLGELEGRNADGLDEGRNFGLFLAVHVFL